MKISDINSQVHRRLELSKVDQIENLAVRKKNEKPPNNDDTAIGSAAIKTDTIQLREEILIR